MTQQIILMDDTNLWNNAVLAGWIWQYGSMTIFYIAFEYLDFIECHRQIFSIFSNLNFCLTQAITIITSLFLVSKVYEYKIMFKFQRL